jgi:hypothetical protein
MPATRSRRLTRQVGEDIRTVLLVAESVEAQARSLGLAGLPICSVSVASTMFSLRSLDLNLLTVFEAIPASSVARTTI